MLGAHRNVLRDGAHEDDPLRFEKRLLDTWLRKEFVAGPD